jgi:hypothetical protein
MKAWKGSRAAGAASSVAVLGLLLASSAPASGGEMILAKAPKKAAEPRLDTSKQRPAHVRENVNLGPGRKAGDGSRGVSNQNAISGVPSKGSKPQPGSSRFGGMEVSVDPGARPDPGTLQRGKGLEGLPGRPGLDPRLNQRGRDPRGGVEQKGEALLGDPRSGGGNTTIQPGDTRFGSKQSMIGKDASGSKAEPTGTTIAPSTFDDEGLHPGDGGKTAKDNEGNELGRIGTLIGSGGLRGPTADAMKQAIDEQDGKSPGAGTAGGDAGSGSSGGSSGSGTADPNEITEYHTSKDGRSSVWKYADGRVEVRNNETGTTTTQYPDGTVVDKDKDGKTTTTEPPTSSIPTPDNPGTPLPDEVQRQIDADLEQLRGSSSRRGGGRNPNHTDPVPDDNDATGTGSGVADESQPIPDKSRLIVTPTSPDGSVARVRPTLDDREPPSGSNPNETDPTPEEP